MNEFYTQLTRQLQALTQDSPVLLSNLSNAAALLYQSIPDINWAGFYLARDRELLLGPFGGKPACLRNPFEKGVCGQAARSLETVVVSDVHAFPGHIACDAASRSEIVLPIRSGGQLTAVLDIDSPFPGRFGPEDAQGLEQYAAILAGLPGWENLLKAL